LLEKFFRKKVMMLREKKHRGEGKKIYIYAKSKEGGKAAIKEKRRGDPQKMEEVKKKKDS